MAATLHFLKFFVVGFLLVSFLLSCNERAGTVVVVHAAEDDKCKICKDIAKKFDEGVKKTEKGNFGGGNTAWEEKSLGSYATSLTRLEEILEGMCNKDHKCLTMVEEAEEHIETYWLSRRSPETQITTDFHSYFCVDTLRHCCAENHFGADCKPCPGLPQAICSGNGDCEGAGSRTGSGKCKCQPGYKGRLCHECRNTYYPLQTAESDAISCQKCNQACYNCTGPSPSHCKECRVGYNRTSEDEPCIDVDECVNNSTLCPIGKYCFNTEGSHSCVPCDNSCDEQGCMHGGSRGCLQCRAGFIKDEDPTIGCSDVDECSTDTSICPVGKYCSNTRGSFNCLDCHGFCDSAVGCTGEGPSKCVACIAGFDLVPELGCKDIDECEKNPCDEGFSCSNSEGSHQCLCQPPRILDGGKCLEPTPQSSPNKDEL